MRAFRNIAAILFLYSVVNGGVAQAHDIEIPESFDDLTLVEIAPDAFVVHGMQALPDVNNRGFMSNSGVLLTDAGVVIVDTGGSADVAAAMLDRIAAITGAPVVAIFNSHVHGDHWLGNAEVLRRFPGIPIFAHERAIARLSSGKVPVGPRSWRD